MTDRPDSERAAFETALEQFADAINDEALAHERGTTSWLDSKASRAAVLASFDAARAAAPQAQPIGYITQSACANLQFIARSATVPVDPGWQPIYGTKRHGSVPLYLAAPDRADDRVRQEVDDTVRLDWLEAKGYPGQFVRSSKQWFDSETQGSDYSPTLRAAIDAAILATKGQQ